MAKKLYGKKKTTRNILIGVIAALVIAAAIFLIVAFQKDGAGMNCFQRSATVASADGVKVSFAEYRVMYEMASSSYTSSKLSDDDIRSLQENCAREVLMVKVYEKEAKALGLSLTEEQIARIKESADQQLASIDQYYADGLIQNGTYSKTALEKQLDNHFQRLGMSRSAYRAFVEQNLKGEYYRQAVQNYYKENGSGIDENELVDYYRKSIEATMTKTAEDGTQKPTYLEGQYWYNLTLYQYGYSTPMMYVPEGFIYVDFIKLEKGSAEEINDIITAVMNGDRSFDELMESADNTDSFKGLLKAPYPIAEKDHSGLYTSDDLFAAANALEIGQIGSFVEEPTVADDGTSNITAYLFRRAEGNMCYDGDHGVIKMDYYEGMRDSVEEQYRADQWLSDIKFDDAIYAYKGALG